MLYSHFAAPLDATPVEKTRACGGVTGCAVCVPFSGSPTASLWGVLDPAWRTMRIALETHLIQVGYIYT